MGATFDTQEVESLFAVMYRGKEVSRRKMDLLLVQGSETVVIKFKANKTGLTDDNWQQLETTWQASAQPGATSSTSDARVPILTIMGLPSLAALSSPRSHNGLQQPPASHQPNQVEPKKAASTPKRCQLEIWELLPKEILTPNHSN